MRQIIGDYGGQGYTVRRCGDVIVLRSREATAASRSHEPAPEGLIPSPATNDDDFEEAFKIAESAFIQDHLSDDELYTLRRIHFAEIEIARKQGRADAEAWEKMLDEKRGVIKKAVDVEALKLLESEFATLREEIEKKDKAEDYLVGFSIGVMQELFREIDIPNIEEEIDLL